MEECFCEYCCNFDKEHIGMDGTSVCKLTKTLAYCEESAKDCKFFNTPAADVQKVKHGAWNVDCDCASVVLSCSLCNEKYWIEREDEIEKHKPNYCPRCGAKMEKE